MGRATGLSGKGYAATGLSGKTVKWERVRACAFRYVFPFESSKRLKKLSTLPPSFDGMLPSFLGFPSWRLCRALLLCAPSPRTSLRQRTEKTPFEWCHCVAGARPPPAHSLPPGFNSAFWQRHAIVSMQRKGMHRATPQCIAGGMHHAAYRHPRNLHDATNADRSACGMQQSLTSRCLALRHATLKRLRVWTTAEYTLAGRRADLSAELELRRSGSA